MTAETLLIPIFLCKIISISYGQKEIFSKKNMVEELERLANLKQQGILTEEEFQQFKTKLLSDI